MGWRAWASRSPSWASSPSAGLALAADAAHPTVIELFQSQGCSSCPPAKANVGAVRDRPDVLALAFEVDYWDRLGWKDTSRSTRGRSANTPMRGRCARRRLHAPSGRQRPRRGRRSGAWRAGRPDQPRRSRSGRPDSAFGRSVTVGRGAAPAGGADVWLARYIPHIVEVTIPRGENGGQRFPTGRGARDGPLRPMARRSGDLPRPGGDPALAEAAIVQASGAGPIIAAAKR